mgnify:CR=1 FL=1
MFCRFLKGFSEWKPSKICSGEEGPELQDSFPRHFSETLPNLEIRLESFPSKCYDIRVQSETFYAVSGV